MIPSRKQWATWSLPSKLTAVGAYVGVFSVALSIGFFIFSPQLPSINETAIVDSCRQKKAFRLVWRMYFLEPSSGGERGLPFLPGENSISLLAFVAFDELYREAYWEERMGISISLSGGLDAPDRVVRLESNDVASPFRWPYPGIPSIVQRPSFGNYLASYWELEAGTTIGDLEKLRYRVLGATPSISRVVLMADDVPIAIFTPPDFGEKKSLNLSLCERDVDPYTGDIVARQVKRTRTK